MIRIIVLLGFVGFLAFAPVYMMDQYVMPELALLKAVYGTAEDMSAKIAPLR